MIKFDKSIAITNENLKKYKKTLTTFLEIEKNFKQILVDKCYVKFVTILHQISEYFH